jgi:DHA1 family bicyclomycin/chloramphenicol resistance-like MFS transporter
MHDTASRCTRVRTLVTLGSVTALGPLSMDMYLPGLPDLTDGFGASTSAGQLTLAACLVGLGVGQLLLGPVSDACGRRRPLLASLVTYVLPPRCVPSRRRSGHWSRCVLSRARRRGAIVVARRWCGRYEGAAAARYYALLMLVTGAAPILAPVVGGQLLRWTSWRGVFGLLAGLGLLMVVLAAVLPETLPSSGRRTGGVRALGPMFRQVLSDRSFVGFALASGLAMAAMFAYLAGSPFVLRSSTGCQRNSSVSRSQPTPSVWWC